MPGTSETTPSRFPSWSSRSGALELERADLAGALVFADRNYRRIAIRRRPHYEALVLCWKSGQRSPIHNHLGSSCVVRVVEGRATETSYVSSPCGKLVPQRSRTFPAGSVTGCRDEAIHQMANLEPPGQDLITLHVYSPPPSCWNYFTLDVTTLADHDRLLREGAETVVVNFGQSMPIAPEGSRDRGRDRSRRAIDCGAGDRDRRRRVQRCDGGRPPGATRRARGPARRPL